jgi:putative sterol carrier protein
MTDADSDAARSGLADADPAQLAQYVAAASKDELSQLMASEYRKTILDDLFGRMAEHLDPERARDVDAVVHFKIYDRPEGGYDHYEVVFSGGSVSVTDAPEQTARATIKVKPADFLKLASGNANGPALFMTGKLKIDGDLLFASRVAGLFRLPTSS